MMVHLNFVCFVHNFISIFLLLRRHIYAAFVVMDILALKYLLSMLTNLHCQCLKSKTASNNLKKLVRFFS